MKDCTTWMRDELLSHLDSGSYTIEQITEALQEMLDALRDPEEPDARVNEPMTQERLNAIWADLVARHEDATYDVIEEDFLDDIYEVGGEAIACAGASHEDFIEKLFAMLEDRGCVVLDNPAAEAMDECGYVVFWPQQELVDCATAEDSSKERQS